MLHKEIQSDNETVLNLLEAACEAWVELKDLDHDRSSAVRMKLANAISKMSGMDLYQIEKDLK